MAKRHDDTRKSKKISKEMRPIMDMVRDRGFTINWNPTHPKVMDGSTVVCTIPTNPSDHRAIQNLRAELRRYVRVKEGQIEKEERKKAKELERQRQLKQQREEEEKAEQLALQLANEKKASASQAIRRRISQPDVFDIKVDDHVYHIIAMDDTLLLLNKDFRHIIPEKTLKSSEEIRDAGALWLLKFDEKPEKFKIRGGKAYAVSISVAEQAMLSYRPKSRQMFVELLRALYHEGLYEPHDTALLEEFSSEAEKQAAYKALVEELSAEQAPVEEPPVKETPVESEPVDEARQQEILDLVSEALVKEVPPETDDTVISIADQPVVCTIEIGPMSLLFNSESDELIVGVEGATTAMSIESAEILVDVLGRYLKFRKKQQTRKHYG